MGSRADRRSRAKVAARSASEREDPPKNRYNLGDGLRLFLLLRDTVYKAQAVGSADASNVVPAWTGCE